MHQINTITVSAAAAAMTVFLSALSYHLLSNPKFFFCGL